MDKFEAKEFYMFAYFGLIFIYALIVIFVSLILHLMNEQTYSFDHGILEFYTIV